MGVIDNKEAMIDQIKKYWLVRVNDGTGVIVSPLDNAIFYVFTCKHVIQDKNGDLLSKDKITVKYDEHTSGKNHTFKVVEIVLSEDEQNDFAIIIVRRDLDDVPHLYLSSDKNECYHIGFPQNRIKTEENFQNSLVLDIRSFDGNKEDVLIEYQYQTAATNKELNGMSGGGIFNKRGELVGIHTQSSMPDVKEMLGKGVMIPIAFYLELIKRNDLSSVLEYDLQRFGDMVSWVFNFDGEKVLGESTAQFSAEIDVYKEVVQEWSPFQIFNVLVKNGKIDSKVKMESLNQAYWQAFTLFVVAIIAFLDLKDSDGEKAILFIFDKFHYCYFNSDEEIDVWGVKDKLDPDVVIGMHKKAFLVVGGLKKSLLRGSIKPSIGIVPDLKNGEVISDNDISRSRSRKQIFDRMTIINNNIFEKVVEFCAEMNDEVSIKLYRDKLVEMIKKYNHDNLF